MAFVELSFGTVSEKGESAEFPMPSTKIEISEPSLIKYNKSHKNQVSNSVLS